MPRETTIARSASREGLLRGAGSVMAHVRHFLRVLNGVDVRTPRD